jgi:hypothetical protein
VVGADLGDNVPHRVVGCGGRGRAAGAAQSRRLRWRAPHDTDSLLEFAGVLGSDLLPCPASLRCAAVGNRAAAVWAYRATRVWSAALSRPALARHTLRTPTGVVPICTGNAKPPGCRSQGRDPPAALVRLIRGHGRLHRPGQRRARGAAARPRDQRPRSVPPVQGRTERGIPAPATGLVCVPRQPSRSPGGRVAARRIADQSRCRGPFPGQALRSARALSLDHAWMRASERLSAW